jgi:hypothetical protein
LLPPPRHAPAHTGGRKLRPRQKVVSERRKGIRDGGLGEDRSSPGPDLDYCGDSDSDKDDSDSDEDEYNLPTKRKVGESTHPPLPNKKRKTDGKKYESQSTKRAQRGSTQETEAPVKTRHSIYALRLAKNPRRTRSEMAPFLEDRRSTMENFMATQSSLYTAQFRLCSSVSQKNEHPETSCDLLELLDLVYSAEVKAIICRPHSMLLPLNAIPSHLRKRHPHLKLDRSTQHDIVTHIRDWLSSDALQSPETTILPETLSTPLTLSPKTIRYRFLCPKCSQWITRNDSYRGCPETEFYSHMKKIHAVSKRPKTVEGSWCQVIHIYTYKKGRPKDHLFRLPNYTPDDLPITPSFATKTYDASQNSTWFRELKWPQHRASILAEIPLEKVRCLLLPPSKQLVLAQLNERDQYIEKGLLHVRAKLTAYLRNGQDFISSLHGAHEGCFKTQYVTACAYFQCIE